VGRFCVYQLPDRTLCFAGGDSRGTLTEETSAEPLNITERRVDAMPSEEAAVSAARSVMVTTGDNDNVAPMSPVAGAASEEDDDPDFRKSFLKTRLVVGVIGVLMPPVIVFGNMLIFGQSGFEPSLSDYYFTGMRNWFVGSLWAIGAGLLVYLAARRNAWDSWFSFVAGLLAIAVALLPTNAPNTATTVSSTLHVVCAGTLFALLGVICFRFGSRDGRRSDRSPQWRRNWQFVHRACAFIVWVAVLVSVAFATLGAARGHVVLVGETVAVLAFGVSWFLKGSEIINMLREDRGLPPVMRQQVVGHAQGQA
jgi:hypothetical protein